MARGDMRRIRIAATKTKRDLDQRLDLAFQNNDPAYLRLNRDYLDAAQLEFEARKGEVAEILNEKIEGAGFVLTRAADLLEAEVQALKDGAENLGTLADAVDVAGYAVGLFAKL